jgi:hypothetical protein
MKEIFLNCVVYRQCQLQRKTCLNATSPAKILTRTGLGCKPVFRVKMPANKHITHNITFSFSLKRRWENIKRNSSNVFIHSLSCCRPIKNNYALQIYKIINNIALAAKLNICNLFYYIFSWLCSPARAMASSSTTFLDHIQRRATVGRTHMDEWSARLRDRYIATHNTHNRHTSMPPEGFEPTIAVGERP